MFEDKDNPTDKEVKRFQNWIKHRLIRILDEIDFPENQMRAAFAGGWEELLSRVEMLELLAVKLHGWSGEEEEIRGL